MGLPTVWIRHLPQGRLENKDFEAAVRNSTIALGRLREILQEEINSLDKSETSDSQFSDPNWSHKQAYRNGQRSKLRYILSILEFDQNT